MRSPRTPSEASNETWMRAVVESLRDVVWVHDRGGAITYCSPSASSVLGYSAADLQDASEQDLIHPFDLAARNAALDRLVATDEPQPPVELRLRSRDGSFRWFEVTDNNLLQDPVVRSIVSTARDVSVRKAAADELIDLSLRDALTALPNRVALMDRLDLALARTERTDRVLAVLFCDLDGFKVINDTLGHAAGDRVLTEVASRLRRRLRKSDTVARTGGDEFVIVCDDLSEVQDAIDIAAQVRDSVELPFDLNDTPASVSMSIGIATVRGVEAKGMDPVRLLGNADTAMYRAKQQGKAGWQMFNSTLIEESSHRSELESELQPALARGEFVLDYRPIFDLRHHTIVGAEALLRWDHPTRGIMLPGQFMAVAEQTGLIVSIGAWALAEACAQLRRWQHELDCPDWISVNLSARQVVEAGLAETLREILAATDLDPSCLWLVLTETALMRAGHSASVELVAVADLGVHLGIDDFGSGHASPKDLQRLPIDFVKIARSFVAELNPKMPTDAGGNAIVATLIELGRGLKLRTIADGIEREDEVELLRGFGCRYGQGNALARSMTGDEFTRVLMAEDDPSALASHHVPPHASLLYGLPRLPAEGASS